MAEVSFVDTSLIVSMLLTWLFFNHQFVSARVYEMRAQMNAGKVGVGESEKVPMLQRLLQFRYSSPFANEPMPDKDIISEMMGHLFVYLAFIRISHDRPDPFFSFGS
jgi:hypothetical protein